MKTATKKLEITLQILPSILILISILYISLYCCYKNHKQEKLEQYSVQINEIVEFNINQNQYFKNTPDFQDKNQDIIFSENKSIAVKKVNKNDFSVVLF